MKTLLEHIDDLDRMVDSGQAPKHEIRSQIAFIGREVAALQAAYAGEQDAHAKLRDAHEAFQAKETHRVLSLPQTAVDYNPPHFQ